MKVLIVNSLFSPHLVGGAELSLDILATALAASGVEVSVVSLTPHRRSTTAAAGITKHYLPICNLYWPFDAVARTRAAKALWHSVDVYNPFMGASFERCVSQEEPDVIHTNNLAGFSIAVWKVAHRLGVPILHTIRDYYMMCLRSARYRDDAICRVPCMECRIPAGIRRAASRWVDGVVGNSRYLLDVHLQQGLFLGARFRDVVYNAAIGTSRGVRAPSCKRVVRFGYLGQIEKKKGLEVLFERFARRTDDGWELAIAGKGAEPYVSRLKAQSPNPRISWLGWVDSSSFLSQIDVLLVPSLWEEPLPRVILEAYQQGVPVIATNRGGIPEVVDEGVSGLLFDPAHPAQLDQIVGRIISSPDVLIRLKMGATAKAGFFTPEQTLAGYLRAYSAVLKNEDRC